MAKFDGSEERDINLYLVLFPFIYLDRPCCGLASFSPASVLR